MAAGDSSSGRRMLDGHIPADSLILSDNSGITRAAFSYDRKSMRSHGFWDAEILSDEIMV